VRSIVRFIIMNIIFIILNVIISFLIINDYYIPNEGDIFLVVIYFVIILPFSSIVSSIFNSLYYFLLEKHLRNKIKITIFFTLIYAVIFIGLLILIDDRHYIIELLISVYVSHFIIFCAVILINLQKSYE